MNIDIINIGHYRVTSHGGRSYELYNRESDRVYSINTDQFNTIKQYRNEYVCKVTEMECIKGAGI